MKKMLSLLLAVVLCCGAMTPAAYAASEEPPFESGVFIYTVVAGDTLWGIAKKCFGTGFKWKDIYEINRDTIKDPNLIFVGQKLKIYAP